jgi:CubicO group peptidase (beta-lactamase class C family)
LLTSTATVVAAGCLPSTGPAPANAAIDATGIEGLREVIKARYPRLQGAVVLRCGVTVFEHYRNQYGPDDQFAVASVTKSVLSILVGIALGDGAFSSLDQRVDDFLPEAREPGVDPRVRDITLQHLLTMTSGFDPKTRSDGALWRAALRRPVVNAPGHRFEYDDDAVRLLSVVLTRAVREEPVAFARRRLFEPLMVERYIWALDGGKHLLGPYGLLLTIRDMAKIGTLYLNGGRSEGRQLVPESFVVDSTRARNGGGPPVRAADYGYLWWVPRTPHEAAFFAAGSGGHVIYVVPELDLVAAVVGDGRQFVEGAVLPALRDQSGP